MGESLDTATAQLAVVIRKVLQDYLAKKETLTILPLKGRTRGDDTRTNFYLRNRLAIKQDVFFYY
jgi:hypothetical protein